MNQEFEPCNGELMNAEKLCLEAGRSRPMRHNEIMAVREGFEPSVRFRTPAFQASSFDHSDTSPCLVYRHAITHQWNLFFASIHPWVSPRSYFLYDRRQTAKLCFGFALPTQTPHRVFFTDLLWHISGKSYRNC